ncbi:MAG: aspartyl aminopeptidase [Methylophagaceae bacterium]|jgi:aspartyl aminopeptidase
MTSTINAGSMAFNQQLCDFLDASPTPFHAVSAMKERLDAAGFLALDERCSWTDLASGQYYVTRNDSSIIAFTLPKSDLAKTGFKMMGAHTDSPCLHVKPQPEKIIQGLCQLGVEVYGGALLNPWFDRDLSMAGRVNYVDANNDLQYALVNFEKAIALIPSLAIHLDRDANKNRTVNAQEHLPPILMQGDDNADFDFRLLLKQQLLRQSSKLDIVSVLDYEICLYDTQGAAITGINGDFISSARLDNLLSCFVGLEALLASDGQQASLLVCSDHEEVGSLSTSGAKGPFLESVLLRLTDSQEDYQRMIRHSWLVSVDNAHAIHPNYKDRHDAEHGPKLNAGPVIKTNANQRYATNSETRAFFRHLCAQVDVPVQDFVVRSDMDCGSTIGPITAGEIGVKTLDVGLASYAMHSIREHAGSRDAHMLFRVMIQFFNTSI